MAITEEEIFDRAKAIKNDLINHMQKNIGLEITLSKDYLTDFLLIHIASLQLEIEKLKKEG